MRALFPFTSSVAAEGLAGVRVLRGPRNGGTRRALDRGGRTLLPHRQQTWPSRRVQSGLHFARALLARRFRSAPVGPSGDFSQQLRCTRSTPVDVRAGPGHARRLHPPLAVHHVTPRVLLLAYPVLIIHGLVNDGFWEVPAVHLLVVGALGLIYRLEKRRLPEHMRVSAPGLLSIALLVPVASALLTPLALRTLDSGGRETLGGVGGASERLAGGGMSLRATGAEGGGG